MMIYKNTLSMKIDAIDLVAKVVLRLDKESWEHTDRCTYCDEGRLFEIGN